MGIDELTERMGMLCGTRLDEAGHMADLLHSRGETVMLLCLSRAEGALLSGELADKSGLSTGRTANLLRQLEAKGLVLRRRDEVDRRKTYVWLTDAGTDEAERQQRALEQSRKELLRYLGEDDAREFVRLLDRCLRFCGQTAA